MTPDLRRRFERLLLDHSDWEDEDERRTLLDPALRPYAIWDDWNPKGTGRVAVTRLLDLEETYGSEPFLAVLSVLREEPATNPKRSAEIAFLADALRQRCARPRKRWPTDEARHEPPYRGLPSLDRRHAPIFFGRDAEVDALIRTLAQTEQGRRFCIVLGASGSGKSSLVRAGLWARLEQGDVRDLPGSERWLIQAMTPLEMPTPELSFRHALLNAVRKQQYESKASCVSEWDGRSIASLTERLLPADRDCRWLLILDQMEELFAPAHKKAGVEFLEWLLDASRADGNEGASRFQVVATLRSDFYHHCLERHSPLQRAVGREGGTFHVPAPGRFALERMVSGPLEELDLPEPWILDPALPPVLAADAGKHEGGLALMAFALRELYDTCLGERRMDLATYRSLGGLGGVIAKRADETLHPFGEAGREICNRVFSRLVRVPQDDAPTRRREFRSEWKDDAPALALIDGFVKARLLVADKEKNDDPVIEVAHEALLREWPTMAGWIDQRREAFALAERVRTETRAWVSSGPAQTHRRPWPGDLIDFYRRQLKQADLLDSLLTDANVARMLTPEVDWLLGELQRSETTPWRRRDIGLRLAELGDPREGVGVKNGLPDILWRAIPGGVVNVEMLGCVPVQAFQIAAYPVTFSQFRAFLEAEDGYRSKQWWKGLQREEQDPVWETGPGNHPVTDVSWFDATAFCRWLTRKISGRRTRRGFEIRLPDEQEWQWAAQSGDSTFFYPWGKAWLPHRANTFEADINRATAVGMFPLGESHQQVADLAGNVWEWCRNQFDSPTETGIAGKGSRVLRGGSWGNSQDSARADARFNFHPDDRNYNLGFRLVSVVPPSLKHRALNR